MELVALIPLLAALGLAVGQLLAAGQARELAAHAAQAGAVAMLQSGDAAGAARAAVPGWSRRRMTVRVRGRRVFVRLRPRSVIPGLGPLLAASSTADAGPAS